VALPFLGAKNRQARQPKGRDFTEKIEVSCEKSAILVVFANPGFSQVLHLKTGEPKKLAPGVFTGG
jgi:hypothetical protein